MNDEKPDDPAERARKWLHKAKVTPADREMAATILLEGMQKALTYRLMYKWHFSEEDSEEMLADSIMKFIKSPPRSGSARAWMYTVVDNLAKDRIKSLHALKHGGGQVPLSLSAALDDADEMPSDIDVASPFNTEDLVALRRFLEKGLSDFEEGARAYVQVLTMIIEQWTLNEIADELGISITAAKDRVYRARLAVRKYFKE